MLRTQAFVFVHEQALSSVEPAVFLELAWMLVVQSSATPSRTQWGNTCREWYWHVHRLEHWRFWQVVMADFSTFPGSSRLSVLWTHDRRRYHQWNRADEVTVHEQHHPGVTHPGDEIWLLARPQGFLPECGTPPALIRDQGDWWRVLKKAQIRLVSQSYSFDDWSEHHEGPNCTLDMLRDSGQNGSESMA